MYASNYNNGLNALAIQTRVSVDIKFEFCPLNPIARPASPVSYCCGQILIFYLYYKY